MRVPPVWEATAAVAAGGAAGALARYGAAQLAPHRMPAFPWTTFTVNVAGCFLIGVLMVALVEVAGRPHRLLRPFLGVGLLGGLTTFSTYTAQTRDLLAHGHTGLALGYLLGTVVGSLAAVQVAVALTRAVVAYRPRRDPG